MKQMLSIFIFSVGIFFLVGCSSHQSPDQSQVNSGPVNETYVGDANIQIEENFMQTETEKQIQEEVLKRIEEGHSNEESVDLGGHF